MKNENLKIIVLTTVHHYSDARIFFKEIPAIQKLFSNLIYIAKHKNKKLFVERDITIDPLPISKSRFERFFRLQYLSFKKIKKHKPDIIHFHDPELIVLMWFVKKYFKCKIVFDIHENVGFSLQVRAWLPKIFKSVLIIVYKIVEKAFINSFDKRIIVLDSFKSLYGDDAITIMNYPIISKNTKFENRNFKERLNLVYVGLITEVRGILRVLQTFNNLQEQITDIHLDLVGRIDTDELKNKINTFIKEKNLADKVTIHGIMPIVDVYKILSRSHFGFSLMEPISVHNEGLSTKIFDYMANGLPYVVSNIEKYKYYAVEENTGIMVDYYNLNDIKVKIIELFNNRTKMEILSQNGLKAVSSKWNWENEAKKLLNMYNTLLD
ncbi:MAG: glycosyltransferase [Melioribacteraceae bacterium]|nr:glycosyltransferase [Melioribacteraceae bacterium]